MEILMPNHFKILTVHHFEFELATHWRIGNVKDGSISVSQEGGWKLSGDHAT